MFILFPAGVDYRTERYPVVTFTFMGICTAVYLGFLPFEIAKGESVELWELANLWLTPSASQWWTYLTSMFVHADFWHLLGNMMYLFLFGSCVEDQIGRVPFAIFYLTAGFFSALVHVVASPDGFSSEIPFGGASGAVSACIGGFLLFLWKSRIEFRYFLFLFFRFFSGEFYLPAWLVISFWFGCDLIGAIGTASASKSSGGTAFAAHVGGTLFGLAAIAVLNFWRKRRTALETEAEEAANQPPNIMIFMNNEQVGPFNRAQIAGMMQLGSIPDDAQFWCEGMSEWQNIRDLGLNR